MPVHTTDSTTPSPLAPDLPTEGESAEARALRLEAALQAAEAALQRSEARAVALTEESPDLVCRLHPDGTLLYANAAYTRFFRRPQAELIGSSLVTLLAPDEQSSWHHALAALTPTAPATRHECQLHTPDGAWHWVHWTIHGLFAPAGDAQEYQLVGRDLTMHRFVEEQLHEREARYHAIVANAAMGICLVDAFGQFLECNPAFTLMTGVSPEELAVLSLAQVTHPDEWQVEHGLLHQLFAGSEPGYALEKRLVTPAGPLWALALTTIIRAADGTPQYAVQLLENIAGRKEAERLRGEYQEKLRALTISATLGEERERRRLAQNLHDQVGQSLAIARIRLGKVCGQLGADAPAMAQELEVIRTLLSEALDYSRTLTSELSPPVLHELGLVPALRWLARHFSASYELPTAVMIEEPLAPIAHAVRVVLYHISRELLCNVVKHAGAEHATIHLAGDDDALVLMVEDDGRGIEAPPPSTTAGGFGLFSVRERVAQLGGTFTLQSAPGRGTRAILRVPAGAE
jgi:PAS domain S-box-containing protein